ncbi:MAG: MarR family transcriptional regulator [Clostridia bacterium]|nr:MarR family transcriptional regulator [Clostridia bacterium]
MNSKDLALYLSTFRQVLKSYNEYIDEALKEYDLSPNATQVLVAVDSIITASEIAKSIDVSKALLSRSVKELQSKGLIEITRSAVDKREQNIIRTSKGDTAARKISIAHDSFARKFFSKYSDEELEVLQALLMLGIER